MHALVWDSREEPELLQIGDVPPKTTVGVQIRNFHLWHVLVPFWNVIPRGLIHHSAEELKRLGSHQTMSKIHHIQELGHRVIYSPKIVGQSLHRRCKCSFLRDGSQCDAVKH